MTKFMGCTLSIRQGNVKEQQLQILQEENAGIQCDECYYSLLGCFPSIYIYGVFDLNCTGFYLFIHFIITCNPKNVCLHAFASRSGSRLHNDAPQSTSSTYMDSIHHDTCIILMWNCPLHHLSAKS